MFIKCKVDAKKLSKNIIDNFIKKSVFDKAKIIEIEFEKRLKYNLHRCNLELIIKIPLNSLNKIYYNYKKGEYFLDLQNPPIFKTNFFIGDIIQKKVEEIKKKMHQKINLKIKMRINQKIRRKTTIKKKIEKFKMKKIVKKI